MNKNTPFKSGDTLRSPDGLVGKLVVKEDTPECEVKALDDSGWKVRSWSVGDLYRVGWRRTYG